MCGPRVHGAVSLMDRVGLVQWLFIASQKKKKKKTNNTEFDEMARHIRTDTTEEKKHQKKIQKQNTQ
jgi:hypothetical protein